MNLEIAQADRNYLVLSRNFLEAKYFSVIFFAMSIFFQIFLFLSI